MYSAGARLLLLISWLVGLAQAIRDDERVDSLQAYRTIDAYLSTVIENCSSESDFIQQTEQSLVKALEAIKIVQLIDKTVSDEPDPGKLTKIRITSNSLAPILHNLLLASESCDQQHIDLLIVVAKYLTHKGQLLNQYAESRINKCWREHVESVSGLAVRILYKDSSSVFDFIDHLTSTAEQIEERTRTNSIHIGQEPIYHKPTLDQLENMLKIIGSAKDAREPKLHFLKRSFDSLFLATLEPLDIEDVYGKDMGAIKRAKRELIQSSLIGPCESIINRFKRLESSGDYYDASLLRSRFEDILAERARSDEELARVLLYLQVCQRAVSEDGTRWLMSSV